MNHLAEAQVQPFGHRNHRGNAEGQVLPQEEPDVVLLHGPFEGMFGLLVFGPFGVVMVQQVMQRLDLQHRTGKVVVAGLVRFVNHTDIQVQAACFQGNRCRQARRAGADNQNGNTGIIFFTVHGYCSPSTWTNWGTTSSTLATM
ncbi:MAG: hypothetical protein BWY71_01456 [Planctomycetes bacterium ADurb.Bin412]|nr:MAG: hypothetical protein BWY71_01456 [Planctomycetes bacterium ADurb.Bin412]